MWGLSIAITDIWWTGGKMEGGIGEGEYACPKSIIRADPSLCLLYLFSTSPTISFPAITSPSCTMADSRECCPGQVNDHLLGTAPSWLDNSWILWFLSSPFSMVLWMSGWLSADWSLIQSSVVGSCCYGDWYGACIWWWFIIIGWDFTWSLCMRLLRVVL